MYLLRFLGFVFFGYCFRISDANNTGDCDFEKNTCQWTNVRDRHLFNWTRLSGETPSFKTGPDRDHTTGSGTYLYIEATYSHEGQVARLISPMMQGQQCMIFWYHMFGTGMGSVTIYSIKNGSWHLLWLKGGNQGLGWHKTVINIRETGKYQVEIDGVRGKDYQSDAAIDDVSFYPGVCKEKAFSTIFVYTNGTHRGLIEQHSTPTPGSRMFQYGLTLQRESFNKNDSFYLLCETKTGLKIVKTNSTTERQSFPCKARDLFSGQNSRRDGMYPFFVIDKGYNFSQTIELKNESALYNESIRVMEMFASSIDFSVNLADNSTVSQSSQVPGFPPTLSVDGNHTTCAQTLVQDIPWLEIALNGSRFIYKVYVTTLPNGHLPNITVKIHDQNVQVWCQTTDLRAKKTFRVFLCQPPLRAQKVRLEFHGKKKNLTICEIIINAVDSVEHLRGVRAETWNNISNTLQLVSFLKSSKRHNSPDVSQTVEYFSHGNYGVNTRYAHRLTSFIQPPSDGRYEFDAWCQDHCKLWMKGLNDFSELTFFEDLEIKKQQVWELLFATKGSYYRSWKNLDSCRMYMIEGALISEETRGEMGASWKKPNVQWYSTLEKVFWLLPGLEILDAKLLEPNITQHSLTVGQTLTILMTYRLCCHGMYCPSCPKTVRIQLLDRTIVLLNSSLSTTCQWYNYTTSITIAVNRPGKYHIKVLETQSNSSTTKRHNLTELNIKARVLQSCFYLRQSCSWSMKDAAGQNGWFIKNALKGHYLEAKANQTAWLQSPAIQPQSLDRSIGLCLVFSYRNNHNSSELEVIIKTYYNKTVLWHLKGIQGHQWNQSTIPWPDVPSSQIIIRAKANINSSVAVSNISLLTMKCSLTPKHAKPGYRCMTNEFQCDNGACIKSSLRCDNDYACADNSDEDNCECGSSGFRCPGGRCLPVTQLCNGIKECQDGSDEESCGNPCKEKFTCLDGSCVLWSVTCDGKLDCQDGSDEPTIICSSLSCPLNRIDCATTTAQNESSLTCHTFRGPCNFDDQTLCELSTRGLKSSRLVTQWHIKKGPTPSSGTGPSTDHTKQTANGSYLYLETSGLKPGQAADLSSAWLKYDSNTCLQFWYHMWGNHVGSLNVYVITNQTQTRNMIWSRTDNGGQIWRFAQTPIYSNKSIFKFVFEATAGNGNEGDIAIDDVDLITGQCDTPSSCGMKKHSCKWQGIKGWLVEKKDEGLIDYQDRRLQDHGDGKMESPTIFPKNGFKCLRFWYFIKKAALLRLYLINSENNIPSLLWSSQTVSKKWILNQIPLPSQYPYKLSFEDTNRVFSTGLHDVALSRDTCQRASSMHENCKHRTTNGDCCVFPFVHQGKCYTQCINSTGYPSSWCSITENYDRDGLGDACSNGNSAIKESPRNCTAIFRQRSGRLHWTPDLSSIVKWSPRQPTGDLFISQVGINGTKTQHSICPGCFELSFNGSSSGTTSFMAIKDLESFTACIWIKTNDTTNKGTIVRYTRNDNFILFGLINYKNIVIKLVQEERRTGMSVNDGKWHHLCFVWISKGGVYEMYKDGSLVVQGQNWYRSSKFSANGTLYIGTDGFVGKISGMNIWTVAMTWSNIAQRAVGCGIRGGDVIDWSRFNETAHLISPPSCLDVGGEGYSVTQNTTNAVTADIFSDVLNGSLADYTTSFCFHFRYNMIGTAVKSLKIYRSGWKEDESAEERVWVSSSTANTPLWRFGRVSLSTLQSYKIRVSASFGPGRGSIGLAGYYLKPGYCSSFSEEEVKGCQVNITSQSNTISSPYFPDSYPNNIECQWWITRPQGYVIRLRFLSFDLEDSPGCHKDYLKIYDGSSAIPSVLGKYCGNSFPLLLDSPSNSLRIAFKSEKKEHSYSLSGFKIFYTSYRKEHEVCNLIEDCPPRCTCSSLKGKTQRVIMSCKGLTVMPRKTPVSTVAIMLSGNFLSRMDYSGISSSLHYIDVRHNHIVSITPYSFSRLKVLTTLRMDLNFIKELRPKVFTGLSSLKMLDLGHNLLSNVKAKTFDDVRSLQFLSLRSNRISRVERGAFQFLKNLTHLYLQSNKIEELPDGVFDPLSNLKVLYLNNNKLKTVTKYTLRNLVSLEVLYLDKNHIHYLNEDAFANLQKLRLLKLDRFVFCCYAVKSVQDLTCISPSSAFSSCDDLMKNKTLQVCIWILGILAFIGNIGVIIWRRMTKERNRVYSFLLTNLALSDLMMGMYLLIIAIKDLEWRGEYFKHDLQWRSSQVCQFAGALSVISSEVSVLILTTITADTFSSIVFAFKFKRLKMRSAAFLVSLIWIFGLTIAVVPILFTQYFYDHDWQAGFYGRSAVCLPLQLSHERFAGWEYSVAIFIVLNCIAFVFILVAYIIMFWKVRSTGRSVRSNQMKTQSAMAKKMVFIIMTDFCCWMPVIVIGVLSLLGKFPDPEKLAYVWIAVFVLPVNSSINPILYTFSTRSWQRKDVQGRTLIESVRHQITRISSRASLPHAFKVKPMDNFPSVKEDALTLNTMRSDSTPTGSRCLDGSFRRPSPINFVHGNVFENEFPESVSFYRNSCEKSDESMVLLKHFCNGDKTRWSHEVEVMERLRKDGGGHPNVMKLLWYSPVQEAPILIDITKLEKISGQGFLICYDLISSTTLHDHLSKLETNLDTQTLLAIATDVINGLSYLERCDVRHNHVTAENILIKENNTAPSIQAVLGGFGQATLITSEQGCSSNTDIKQYGTLMKHLVDRYPNADPENKVKNISIKCEHEPNTLTTLVITDFIEEVLDGHATCNTLL